MSVFVMTVFMAFKVIQQATPWVVPEKNAKMDNPVKADDKSVAAGKVLYTKNCADCHGKKGLGDGSKAADIKTTVTDLTTSEFQGQTDGAIFYKISEGRKDMPKTKKDLPDDEDRWAIVNYLRTLKKK